MADVVIKGGPRTPSFDNDSFDVDVLGVDGWSPVTFARVPGFASWADADFVWRVAGKRIDRKRHISLFAISGVLLAARRESDTTYLELIVAEYRRRFDELCGQSDARVVFDEADFARLTSSTAPALERVGREIDKIVFELARRIPGTERFSHQQGTLDLKLVRPRVWPVESVGLHAPASVGEFYTSYDGLFGSRITPMNATDVATELGAALSSQRSTEAISIT